MEKVKKICGGLWNKFNSHTWTQLFIKQGGKVVPYFPKIMLIVGVMSGPLILLVLFSDGVDSSYVGRSATAFKNDKSDGTKISSGSLSGVAIHKGGSVVEGHSQQRNAQTGAFSPAKLLAKQVVIREGSTLGYGFTPGSNLIGELVATIDTRDPSQMVRVVLPFGGKSKDGSSELPKGTVLLGQASYPGKGEKVFIQFQQALLPDGKPIKLSAVALDPKDYSSGVTGDIQSQAKTRAMAVVGLGIASAMGDVLTEKEALGQGYQVTAKSNLKNAILAGASKAAEVEMGNLQQESNAQDYIQVEAGSVVIVSLTQGLPL